MRYRNSIAVAFIACALALPAAADNPLDSVQIHGFGGWAYGKSDGNAYLAGTEDGGYDDRSFALNVSAEPNDRLAIHTQAFWGRDPGDVEEIVAELDFAFAEWTFSDRLRLRAGVVKQPFGIYNELFEVGTERPFFHLPLSVYGGGLTAKGYRGVGLTGRYHGFGRGWNVQYDLYGGELELPEIANPFLLELFSTADFDVNSIQEVVDMVGGRIAFGTPIEGLSFGASAYHGSLPDDAGSGESGTDQQGFGLHVEYLTEVWSARAESARRRWSSSGTIYEASYAEVARRLGEHWQLAVRWEEGKPPSGEEDDPFVARVRSHEDVAIGVNYWLSHGMVFKASFHQVKGNYLAFPELPEDASAQEVLGLLFSGGVDNGTELIQLGVQFSF